MGRSNRITLRDVIRISRLIHDARDVGHDPAAWPVVLVQGLARIFDARTVAMTCVERPVEGRAPRAEGLADTGWDSTAEREEWQRRFGVLQEFREDVLTSRFMEAMNRLTTRTRDQLVGDDEWFRSTHYNELYRPFGLNDLLLSFGDVDGGRAGLGFGLDRPKDARPLGTRERRLFRLFHGELHRQIDRSLIRKPASPDLPPRLKKTLDCLLQGDSAGQVALRLGLSRHTVNEYIADLYRLFDVRSRAELLALCLRRGVPAPRDEQADQEK